MLRKSTDSLVIKPRLSAPARLAIVAGAMLVVAAASIAGYWSGRALLHERLESRGQEIERLEEALQDSQETRREQAEAFQAERERQAEEFHQARQSLESQLDAARERLVETRQRLETTQSSLTRVTRQLQIDQTAYTELRKDLEESNRQITELAGELKFYRSIISPADGRSGVRIQQLDLQPAGDEPGQFRYRLVLIQALEHDTNAQGQVSFELRGTSDGQAQSIAIPGDARDPIPADFKYFQNFAGTFTLPAGFVPAEVEVIFEAADAAVVRRTFPWPAQSPPAGS
ncbi:MAG TPA: DUF6776 family protein [Arenicellales bacterium]|nr:DUF6776 family protein [Arenicellales bacterium]